MLLRTLRHYHLYYCFAAAGVVWLNPTQNFAHLSLFFCPCSTSLHQSFTNLPRNIRDLSKYQLSTHSLNIQQYKLHYTPQHVSSSTLLIIRRANCVTTASGIVTLCKQPYSMQVESGLSLLSTRILYGCLQRVTIPEAVVV